MCLVVHQRKVFPYHCRTWSETKAAYRCFSSDKISAELRLAFGQLADKEMLHSPYVEKNAGIILLLKAGENGNAAATLETYLNISERTILAALARSR